MLATNRFTRNTCKIYFFIKNMPFVLLLVWLSLVEWAKEYWVKIQWWFDFYIAYMLYSQNKRFRYNKYMLDRWGDKYRDKVYDQEN